LLDPGGTIAIMQSQSVTDSKRGRLPRALDRALDIAMRVIPGAALVAVGALFAAQQAVAPSHRAIKALVLMGLMGLMFRFDMVYSVYLFALLFPFPSGISIGSSNNVLMTVIPMIWAVRATSAKIPVLHKTAVDRAIGLFLLAFVVSLFNVTEGPTLARGIGVIWRQLTAVAFFYSIFMFANDEKKLFRLGKIMCIACFLVMTTAVIEVFHPGATLIPGWIGLEQHLGKGMLSTRVKGLRAGGAFESHGMLADFGTQLILFMVFFFLRSRNPAEKFFWLLSVFTTIFAILTTANRGATAGLFLGCTLAILYFRRVIGITRIVVLVAFGLAGLYAADAVLSERTVAVSVFDRFEKTEFQGMVPENRTMTWKPALDYGMQSPLIGHGPCYDTGVGLTKRYWPHNGYLFYFATIGLLGLGAFLWIMWMVYRESRNWRRPGIIGTPIGNFLAIGQIWFFVMAFEQLRTDHQREDIYPYIVWMCFGVVVATANIARRQLSQELVSATPRRAGR